jgi:hypothetical protein
MKVCAGRSGLAGTCAYRVDSTQVIMPAVPPAREPLKPQPAGAKMQVLRRMVTYHAARDPMRRTDRFGRIDDG